MTKPEPPTATQHPYYPQSRLLVAHYAPNARPLPLSLGLFAAVLAAPLAVVFLAGGMLRRWLLRAGRGDGRGRELVGQEKGHGRKNWVVGWFVLCGTLHCLFEGFFVLNHRNLASSQSLFAQLWKEYALSDSRYLISDPFMLCVESITVMAWGPLSFLTAYFILTHSPHRHVLQVIVCVAHLYGVALYYSTSLVEERMTGVSYSRPEALYFWGYYVGFNAPWVLIPAWLLWCTARDVAEAVRRAESREMLERRLGRISRALEGDLDGSVVMREVLKEE